MPTFTRIRAAEAEAWGLELLDRDAPRLELGTPPPTPPPTIAVAVAPEPQFCYRVGPLNRDAAQAVLDRLRHRDIPFWARPFVIGALVTHHQVEQIEFYIDNVSGHVTVWLALQKLGAQKATLPDRAVWLTGNAITKWVQGTGEPVRRLLLTGAAANGADEAQRTVFDGQP